MKSNYIVGMLLIFLGGVFLANNLLGEEIFSLVNMWPVFILGLGLIFEFSYFMNRQAAGLLVPGGILTTIGLLFLFETFTDWRFAEYTWPVYPLAVAIGLFQLYLAAGRQKALLIPVGIIGGFSMISFSFLIFGNLFQWIDFGFVLPGILILIGLLVIGKGLKEKR